MVGLTKTKFENKSNKYKKKAFRKILFDEFFERFLYTKKIRFAIWHLYLMREKEKDTQGLYTKMKMKMKMKMKHTNAQLARKKTYLTAKLAPVQAYTFHLQWREKVTPSYSDRVIIVTTKMLYQSQLSGKTLEFFFPSSHEVTDSTSTFWFRQR